MGLFRCAVIARWVWVRFGFVGGDGGLSVVVPLAGVQVAIAPAALTAYALLWSCNTRPPCQNRTCGRSCGRAHSSREEGV
eukprot:4101001-Pyramimonas_sp.AAC.1